MNHPLLTLSVSAELDVVSARQRARQLAELLGFDTQDQTRIATAVSEIARNAAAYAKGGKVEFSLEGRTAPQLFVVKVSDKGPGIRDLQTILEGRYRSATGMGIGLLGTKRLMDSFEVQSTLDGTTVTLRKLIVSKSGFVGPAQIQQIAKSLDTQRPTDHLSEIRQQNRELLTTLEELRKRQDELHRLNRELEDTNRGVVALYAELEERAHHLRRADEVKTRFLSNMTHEFRTPVNSILALSGLLMDRADGELNIEQERQVGYIRKAAADLSELINDLLDLARVEAGKVVIRTNEFEVANLFGALRGMLKPLLVSQSVSLVFEDPDALPSLNTDESKISQILRNFISNALKFTERGEIRVRAYFDGVDRMSFSVADTGLGIPATDLKRIFEEFGQLENPIQRKVKGTGLGLPLSKRLAELLGGEVTVLSEVGKGSTFTVTVPCVYAGSDSDDVTSVKLPKVEEGLLPILAIEDHAEDRLVYDRLLRGSQFQLISVSNLRQAADVLRGFVPKAILLDVMFGHQDAWKFLAELKEKPATSRIPVLMVTSIDDRAKAESLGADAYGIKPIQRGWLLEQLQRLVFRRTALIIDDEETSRYTMRQLLRRAGWEVAEASNGPDGIARALSLSIEIIFLDMSMPEMTGMEVLRRIRGIPSLADKRVFMSSAAALTSDEAVEVQALNAGVLPKGQLDLTMLASALQSIK